MLTLGEMGLPSAPHPACGISDKEKGNSPFLALQRACADLETFATSCFMGWTPLGSPGGQTLQSGGNSCS